MTPVIRGDTGRTHSLVFERKPTDLYFLVGKNPEYWLYQWVSVVSGFLLGVANRRHRDVRPWILTLQGTFHSSQTRKPQPQPHSAQFCRVVTTPSVANLGAPHRSKSCSHLCLEPLPTPLMTQAGASLSHFPGQRLRPTHLTSWWWVKHTRSLQSPSMSSKDPNWWLQTIDLLRHWQKILSHPPANTFSTRRVWHTRIPTLYWGHILPS